VGDSPPLTSNSGFELFHGGEAVRAASAWQGSEIRPENLCTMVGRIRGGQISHDATTKLYDRRHIFVAAPDHSFSLSRHRRACDQSI
jgi:hypothetical protein